MVHVVETEVELAKLKERIIGIRFVSQLLSPAGRSKVRFQRSDCRASDFGGWQSLFRSDAIGIDCICCRVKAQDATCVHFALLFYAACPFQIKSLVTEVMDRANAAVKGIVLQDQIRLLKVVSARGKLKEVAEHSLQRASTRPPILPQGSHLVA
eukprot:52013-Rhodomonas_salina.2